MSDTRMIAVPLLAYNDMLEMNGRVKSVIDYVVQNGTISVGNLLCMLGRPHLAIEVEKKNEEKFKKLFEEGDWSESKEITP